MWNYRILYHADAQPTPYFALHEVFYTEDGTPHSWTETPIEFACGEDEGAAGVVKSLEMALSDARKYPALVVRDGKISE